MHVLLPTHGRSSDICAASGDLLIIRGLVLVAVHELYVNNIPSPRLTYHALQVDEFHAVADALEGVAATTACSLA